MKELEKMTLAEEAVGPKMNLSRHTEASCIVVAESSILEQLKNF
jgi:hypothetical protein